MADHLEPDHSVSIASEPYDSPDAAALRAEVEHEMIERYGGDHGAGMKPAVWEVADFLLARDGRGQAIGCGALRPLAGGVAEIKRMYVRPAARGNGVSRLLLAALEERARSLGYAVVRLETGTAQPEAMGLYASAGYTEISGFGAYADSPRSRSFERVL